MKTAKTEFYWIDKYKLSIVMSIHSLTNVSKSPVSKESFSSSDDCILRNRNRKTEKCHSIDKYKDVRKKS